MAKDIFLTNSLGGKKDKFIPKNEKSIGMYVCCLLYTSDAADE